MSSPERIVPTPHPGCSTYPSLALASRGDALTPYLFDALQRRYSLVGLIDPELSITQRYRVAALTVRPNRSQWVERFYKSAYATRLRSANATRVLRSLPQRPDLLLQVHALFEQSDAPSVLYVDCTHAQSASLWPAWNPLRGRALREWYRREQETYSAARHMFTFSKATRASLIGDYGIDPEKVTVTGAGVNFARLPDLPAIGGRRQEGAPTILFIGNDFVRKGGMVLLDAFQQVRAVLPGARLQLIGVNAGLHRQPGVEILGRIADRDLIAAHYAAATVFVVPSFFDPYPLVALEAMAFGLPVITTNQMGTPEMLSNGRTGLLVEPGNAGALASAVLQVLLEPKLAARIGAAARRDVELKFTWDAVVDRMAPVLERLMAETAA